MLLCYWCTVFWIVSRSVSQSVGDFMTIAQVLHEVYRDFPGQNEPGPLCLFLIKYMYTTVLFVQWNRCLYSIGLYYALWYIVGSTVNYFVWGCQINFCCSVHINKYYVSIILCCTLGSIISRTQKTSRNMNTTTTTTLLAYCVAHFQVLIWSKYSRIFLAKPKVLAMMQNEVTRCSWKMHCPDCQPYS